MDINKYICSYNPSYQSRNYDENNFYIMIRHKQDYFQNSYFVRTVKLRNNLYLPVVYMWAFWLSFKMLTSAFFTVGPRRRISKKNHSDLIPIFSPRVVRIQKEQKNFSYRQKARKHRKRAFFGPFLRPFFWI